MKINALHRSKKISEVLSGSCVAVLRFNFPALHLPPTRLCSFRSKLTVPRENGRKSSVDIRRASSQHIALSPQWSPVGGEGVSAGIEIGRARRIAPRKVIPQMAESALLIPLVYNALHEYLAKIAPAHRTYQRPAASLPRRRDSRSFAKAQ